MKARKQKRREQLSISVATEIIKLFTAMLNLLAQFLEFISLN